MTKKTVPAAQVEAGTPPTKTASAGEEKTTSAPKENGALLSGAELLAKVKELGDASKTELVRSCGYVSTKKNGTERLNYTAFYEALLEAKGMNLGESHGAKPGRKLSFSTKVQFNGNLMVGKAYTALLDLKPGDEFEIKLGRRQIRLLPHGSSREEADHGETLGEEEE